MNTPPSDTGGPAFPTNGGCSGLTKREWFAGMALQGAVASNSYKLFQADEVPYPDVAVFCCNVADELLACLKDEAASRREGELS
jgi:hypothetical protein